MRKKVYDNVIVIIATSMSRTDILIERSLRSVYEQTNVNPKCIFIVDDNKKSSQDDKYSTEYWTIKDRVKSFRKEFFSKKLGIIPDEILDSHFHTTVIPNKRTHGKSGTGAWNTAAFRAIRFGLHNYIAILDDDDEWAQNYLHECLKKARLGGKRKRKDFVAAVVTGILRKEQNRDIEIIPNKYTFTNREFYIGNPGFQGSNIFIRLRTFWEIGGFDENLSSATDRDLALRLIEYCSVLKFPKIRFRQQCFVTHHAYSPDRVTADPLLRGTGLRSFYAKYLHFMNDEEKEQSLLRAKRLFGFSLSQDSMTTKNKTLRQKKRSEKDQGQLSTIPFNLFIGMTSNNPENLRESLIRFQRLIDHPLIKHHQIVILENSEDEYCIRPIICYFIKEKTLNIRFIDTAEQKTDIETFPFLNIFSKELLGNKSIAFSRSLLQWYLTNISREHSSKDIVIWIVDDDAIPESLFLDNTNSVVIRQLDYIGMIGQLRDQQTADAVLGTVTDAPPLPFLSSIRTQLLDLQFNLHWFERQVPEHEFPFNTLLNYSHMENSEDYYYDLSSKEFQHLETPFWWFPLKSQFITMKEAFQELLNEIAMIGSGVNIFRPIFIKESRFGEINGPSVFRGGNTIVFSPEMLQVPNYAPNIHWKEEKKKHEEITLRRSDFMWALMQEKLFHHNIIKVLLPLRHHRRLQQSSFIYNENKLVGDVFGLVLYRVILQMLNDDGFEMITKKQMKIAEHYFTSKLKETIWKLKINNLRARYLSVRAINILGDKKNWWFKTKYRIDLNNDIEHALSTLKSLKYEIGKRKFGEFLTNIEKNMNTNKQRLLTEFLEDMKFIMAHISKIYQ